MLMKTSFYGLVAVLLCSVFHPAMAQTPAAPEPVAPPAAEQPPAPFAVPTDFEAAATPDTPAEETTSAEAKDTPAEKDDVVTDKPLETSWGKRSYYDQYGNPYSSKYHESEAGGILIALQRDPELPAGNFVLFLSMAKSYVGCTKVMPPKYSTEFVGDTMIVKIEKAIIDQRDMPRYAHYECNSAPKEPSISINLNKQLLEDHQVKKIKFRQDKTSETFKVKMTDDYIQLTPEARRDPNSLLNRFRPLNVDSATNPLKFWFYPEGTVILSADGASKDITIESKLIELARSKGLTPLNDIIPDHAHYRKKSDRFYFVDKQNRYNASEDGLFDYIQTDAMKYGLEADEPIKKNLAVFIRKPGRYD